MKIWVWWWKSEVNDVTLGGNEITRQVEREIDAEVVEEWGNESGASNIWLYLRGLPMPVER